MRLTRHHAEGHAATRRTSGGSRARASYLAIVEMSGTGFATVRLPVLFYGRCGPVQALLPTHRDQAAGVA